MSRVHDVISRKVARKYIINNCNHLAKLARYNLHVATDRHGMYGVKYGAASLSRGGLSDTIPVDMPLIETSCHTCPVTTVVTAKNRLRAFAARELQDVYKWCTFHTLLEASWALMREGFCRLKPKQLRSSCLSKAIKKYDVLVMENRKRKDTIAIVLPQDSNRAVMLLLKHSPLIVHSSENQFYYVYIHNDRHYYLPPPSPHP